MVNSPMQLYVPPLVVGQAVQLIWKPVVAASSYLIEVKADEESWLEVFQGPGDIHISPDVGVTWFSLDAQFKQWNEVDAANQTWEQFEARNETELSWEGRDASWKTWTQKEEDNLTWSELDTLPIDTGNYLSTTVSSLPNADRIVFRIQALSAEERSPYLSTDIISICDRVHCSLSVTLSEPIVFQIAVANIESFHRLIYTVTYPTAVLKFNDVFFDRLAGSSDVYEISPLQIKHFSPGKIVFALPIEIERTKLWEGQIIQILFLGLQSKDTEIQFEKTAI